MWDISAESRLPRLSYYPACAENTGDKVLFSHLSSLSPELKTNSLHQYFLYFLLSSFRFNLHLHIPEI